MSKTKDNLMTGLLLLVVVVVMVLDVRDGARGEEAIEADAAKWNAWCRQAHQTLEDDFQLGAAGDGDALRRFAAGNIVGDSEQEVRACASDVVLEPRSTCKTLPSEGPVADETKQCLLRLMKAAAHATARKEDANG